MIFIISNRTATAHKSPNRGLFRGMPSLQSLNHKTQHVVDQYTASQDPRASLLVTRIQVHVKIDGFAIWDKVHLAKHQPSIFQLNNDV